MISVGFKVAVTDVRVDLWDQETFQDYLQLEHRYATQATQEILAILGGGKGDKVKEEVGTISFSLQELYQNTVTIFL